MFSIDDYEKLKWINVQRTWLADCYFPEGQRRLHTGMNRLLALGETWEGVNDPFGGQLVGISAIEEPMIGQAAAIDVVLSGANKSFLRSMWENRHGLIGSRCDLYFTVIEPETFDFIISPTRMIKGKFSAPQFSIVGASIRAIKIKIVGPWEALNFPEVGYMWSPAGARHRNPGDKGQDFVNDEIIDDFKK